MVYINIMLHTTELANIILFYFKFQSYEILEITFTVSYIYGERIEQD